MGESEEGTEMALETYEVDQGIAPMPGSVQYRNRLFKGKGMFKASAGYLSRAGRLHFKEFLNSPERYEVAKGAFLPIVLTKAKAKMESSFPSPIPSVFEYRYAFDTGLYEGGVTW